MANTKFNLNACEVRATVAIGKVGSVENHAKAMCKKYAEQLYTAKMDKAARTIEFAAIDQKILDAVIANYS